MVYLNYPALPNIYALYNASSISIQLVYTVLVRPCGFRSAWALIFDGLLNYLQL